MLSRRLLKAFIIKVDIINKRERIKGLKLILVARAIG